MITDIVTLLQSLKKTPGDKFSRKYDKEAEKEINGINLAIDIAIKAISRWSYRMMPTGTENQKTHGVNYHCNSCGSSVGYRTSGNHWKYKHTYCQKCGQHQEWRDWV